MAFPSSDGAAGLRPTLVIQYTDEAPAVAVGTAEIQPRTVRTESKGSALSAWLDVDALASTPSGTPTGFDELIVTHQGGLVVTGVDRLLVNSTLIPVTLVTFTDDGKAVTFRFPRVRFRGQVRLDFHARIVAPASAEGLDLPMSVDDSAWRGLRPWPSI